ncbi:MAG: MarR family transcriptional regulator [Chloroflexi bacterium]|nr:MarR family transcriptional regulator [Chloroflexota bacterium]
MPGDSHEDSGTGQIAQVVRDLMLLKTRFKAFLPGELVSVQDALDGMSGESKAEKVTNYHLFYLVSSMLYKERSLTMGELSSALGVPLSTATRMVDWMVQNGYVARLPDLEDRRIVRVALTDAARPLFEMAERHLVERVQQLLSGLTYEERSTLFSLLAKALHALKTAT